MFFEPGFFGKQPRASNGCKISILISRSVITGSVPSGTQVDHVFVIEIIIHTPENGSIPVFSVVVTGTRTRRIGNRSEQGITGISLAYNINSIRRISLGGAANQKSQFTRPKLQFIIDLRFNDPVFVAVVPELRSACWLSTRILGSYRSQ